MRVVHVAPTGFGAGGLFGGGERYPLELCRALATHVDCELVTFGPQPGRWREPGGLSLRVLRPLLHLRGHPAHPLGPGLVGAVRGADVVHAHHLRAAPSRMAAVVARARGRVTAVTDHGLEGGSWAGLLPRLFDRFLVVSRYSARLLGADPARTKVVYGGVDPRRFSPDSLTGRSGVLFVGRLTPHKGVDRLITALPPGSHLTVVGTGGHDPRPPERDYPALLRRLAAERSASNVEVAFAGAVGEDALPGFYRRAAVLVLPTVERTCYGRPVGTTELLGLAVLEAMASGTPVVCSRTGALAEVVRDGETGFLVDPGDVDTLRDRLALLLGDARLAASMGANARDAALAEFTWESCARRCVDAYEAALAGRDGPTGAR